MRMNALLWKSLSKFSVFHLYLPSCRSFDKVDPLMKAIKETKEMAHQFQNGLESNVFVVII